MHFTDGVKVLTDSLSKLSIIDSMTAFNSIPVKLFDQTISETERTLQELNSGRILWKFISAKQQGRISEEFVETFKRLLL